MYARLGCANCTDAVDTSNQCVGAPAVLAPSVPEHSHLLEMLAVAVAVVLVLGRRGT